MRRLVLFDIDGTLVAGGPAKDAFRTALTSTFGTAGAIEIHDFAGKTDPQIARELLRAAGLDDAAIDRGLPDLWGRYLEGLEAGLAERPMEVLPGVRPLLAAIEREGDVALGLLTGNISEGARLKLSSVGLFERFGAGGFGSDAEERDLLTAVALRRARERWGVPFRPADVVVVGDTPRDVLCGRAGGTRTLAVATGRFDHEHLRAAGADHVLDDLGDTEAALAILVA